MITTPDIVNTITAMAQPIKYLTVNLQLWSKEGRAFLSDDVVPQLMREIVGEIARQVEKSIKGLIQRESICVALANEKRRFGKSVLATYLSQLRNIDVLLESRIDVDGRPTIVEHITSLSAISQHYANEARKRDQKPIRRRSEKETEDAVSEVSRRAEFMPGLPTDSIGRHEGLMCGILDAATRLSPTDQRRVINTEYKFPGGESIQIKTMTLSDNREISLLSDQRVIRALNSMFLEYVQERFATSNLPPERIREIDTLFAFDLNDLVAQLGLENRTSSRESVRKILQRLADTTYEIDAGNSAYFRNRYALSADTATYRYLTEFFARKDHEQIDHVGQVYQFNERFYIIRFHSMVLYNLLTLGESFNSHPALTKDTSGLAQRLANWSKAFIGVRSKSNGLGEERYEYTLSEFHERVMPSVIYRNFERDLTNLLKREALNTWTEKGPNISRIYGYFYQYEIDVEKHAALIRRRRLRSRHRKDVPIITVWRDRDDQYVGDNSMHNQALRRQAVLFATGDLT